MNRIEDKFTQAARGLAMKGPRAPRPGFLESIYRNRELPAASVQAQTDNPHLGNDRKATVREVGLFWPFGNPGREFQGQQALRPSPPSKSRKFFNPETPV